MSDDLRKVIASRGSPTALAALDTWHAALWLLAVGEIPQSLAALHHATELSLKGLLEELNVALTAIVRKDKKDKNISYIDSDDYDYVKCILANEIRSHILYDSIICICERKELDESRLKRVERAIEQLQYDPDRTICFGEAIDRVQELLLLDPKQVTSLKERFHGHRNEIVHSGAKS